MVWFCATGCHKIRENSDPVILNTMDFRKADPTYVNFDPTTAEEAINKFYRHKNLGVPPHLWPEVFVKCAAKLSGAELTKFESWLVNPQGEPTGALLLQVDRENEILRKRLEAEANARDKLRPVEEMHSLRSCAAVESLQVDENYMDVDEKQQPPSEDTCSVSSMLTNLDLKEAEDFDMITASER